MELQCNSTLLRIANLIKRWTFWFELRKISDIIQISCHVAIDTRQLRMWQLAAIVMRQARVSLKPRTPAGQQFQSQGGGLP